MFQDAISLSTCQTLGRPTRSATAIWCWPRESLGEHFFESVKLEDEVHVGVDPLATIFYSVVSFDVADFRVLVKAISDDKTGGTTDSALAVNENTFPSFHSIIDQFA